jgi:hypothetical protein
VAQRVESSHFMLSPPRSYVVFINQLMSKSTTTIDRHDEQFGIMRTTGLEGFGRLHGERDVTIEEIRRRSG